MKKTIPCFSLILTLASASAFAQYTDFYQDGVYSYVGVDAGYGNIYSKPYNLVQIESGFTNPDGSNIYIPATGRSSGGFAYGLNGGYLWNANRFGFGGELAFNGYPNTQYTTSQETADVEATSVLIMAVGKYYFPGNISIALKGGGAYVVDTYDNNNTDNSQTTNNMQAAVGASIAYAITQNISINLNGHYIFGDPDADFNEGLNKPILAVMGGVSYNF